jgi:formate dehydrogenase major subunit
MVETETASFWYASPEVERGELSPETIGTEVFLFPAAGTAEKAGTFTNTQRLLQHREKAINPPGDARSETWFLVHLGRRLKKKVQQDQTPKNAGLQALTWDYTTEGPLEEPRVEEVLREINGWTLPDRKQLGHIKDLKNDGSTACGAWIYCGVYPEKNRNRAKERNPKDLLGHGWGFSWPNDCRILYNRASARPDGKPWSERKKLVWWDPEKKEWTGLDVPDYEKNMSPEQLADLAAGHGTEALGGAKPFTLHPDGVGWLYVASGLKDGPLPAHYEPLESLVENPFYDLQTNPPADKKERPDNPYARANDARFPYILTTYRLTEHHTAGGMTRTLSHLAELQPELFTEVSPELAAEVGLKHGDWATIVTARALVEARVLVTSRMRPMIIDGRTVHQIGLPYHWGYQGKATGDIVNDLLAISEEPNVRIMETKALTCNIIPGPRLRGQQALDQFNTLLTPPQGRRA